MTRILFLYFLFIQTFASAQTDTVFVRYRNQSEEGNFYQIDTILGDNEFNQKYLIGACILPSHNTLAASYKGIYFSKVSKTPCSTGLGEGTRSEPMETQINGYQLTDSTLVVDMTFVDNCCFEFLCEVNLSDDGILHLQYTGYGTHCSCFCCFGTAYHFELDKRVEDYQLKGIMLANDKKTLIRFE